MVVVPFLRDQIPAIIVQAIYLIPRVARSHDGGGGLGQETITFDVNLPPTPPLRAWTWLQLAAAAVVAACACSVG